MSHTPTNALFDLQRTMLSQSQQAITQGMQSQRQLSQVAFTGMKTQESIQRHTLELSHVTAHTAVSTLAAMTNAAESRQQHEAIDEMFERLKETHAAFYDTITDELERGVDSVAELSAAYEEAFTEQTAALHTVSEELEGQTSESVTEFARTVREQLERTQEMQRQLDEQFERQTTQVEDLLTKQREQAEAFQGELEHSASELHQHVAESLEELEVHAASEDDHHLELIDGLGSTYADRLERAGISSIDELAATDSEAVAEVAAVSEERAREWIQQAAS